MGKTKIDKDIDGKRKKREGEEKGGEEKKEIYIRREV